MVYQPRIYRNLHRSTDLVSFNVMIEETDLYISALSNLEKEARESIVKYRNTLEDYIKENDIFLTSLKPLSLNDNMPLICKLMVKSTQKAGVGPMASVAGVMAELVGKDLLKYSTEIIIENGGDIFIKTDKKRNIGIFAGNNSPFRDKIIIQIDPQDTPLGICTSSGTIGHSLSFGKPDAVTVLAKDAGLSDACATAIGNIIQTPNDFEKGVEFAKRISGLNGLILVKDDKLIIWGNVKLC